MFGNVVDQRLRQILASGSTEPSDLVYALGLTEVANATDAADEDLMCDTLDEREDAYAAAAMAWENGDGAGCIAGLRHCWSV